MFYDVQTLTFINFGPNSQSPLDDFTSSGLAVLTH